MLCILKSRAHFDDTLAPLGGQVHSVQRLQRHLPTCSDPTLSAFEYGITEGEPALASQSENNLINDRTFFMVLSPVLQIVVLSKPTSKLTLKRDSVADFRTHVQWRRPPLLTPARPQVKHLAKERGEPSEKVQMDQGGLSFWC